MPLKLSQYRVDEKANVQWHRTNRRNVSKTEREFGVDRKRVWEWNCVYDNLLLNDVGTLKTKRKLRQNVINCISRAWENISQQTIIDASLSCGISNNLDGTDDRVSEKFLSFDEGDLRGELGDLLFDSDTDSELDFDEFHEYDI